MSHIETREEIFQWESNEHIAGPDLYPIEHLWPICKQQLGMDCTTTEKMIQVWYRDHKILQDCSTWYLVYDYYP